MGESLVERFYTITMRVIAGRFRRRRLLAPPGNETRPILDRVKVALFDWLGSRLAVPGELPPLCVLDLFCGGGSLGIESLSRGARFCAFVDSDPRAVDCLRKNLDALGVGSDAQVVSRAAENARVAGPDGPGFDLIFLDPPYRLSEDMTPGSVMVRVLDRMGGEIPVAPTALLIWRHDARLELTIELQRGWRPAERRRWGNMAISLFERPTTVTD